MQVIIYQQGNGVAVVIPAPNSGLTINEVAAKDVPEGASWRVVDDSSLPSYDSRDRWEWTESGDLTVAAAPVSRPPLTRTQLFGAMLGGGLITEAEALAAVQRSALPAQIIAVIDALPAGQQPAARVQAFGAETIPFDHSMVALFQAAFSLDDAAKLALWDAGLAL